jgi:hypothetical protein
MKQIWMVVRKWWSKLKPEHKALIILTAITTIALCVLFRQYILYVLGGAALAIAGMSKIKVDPVRKPDPVKPDKVEPPHVPSTAGDIIKRKQERAERADKLRRKQ